MTEPAPEYTPEQYESAIDHLTDMITARNATLANLRKKCDDLEAQLEACEAANAYLLAESRVKSAPGYQAGGWRQWEKRL